MKKFSMVCIKRACLVLMTVFCTVVFAQQNTPLQIIKTNPTDYEVKVFSPQIHLKIANTQETSVQKKFLSIKGLLAIDRSQPGYFILKLEKTQAKIILEKYFQLTPAQTSILP